MLTTTQLISCINEDSQLNNIIRAQHNREANTIAIFSDDDIWAFMRIKLGKPTVSTEFIGELPKQLTSDKLRRLFEHIAEYEKTPLDDREDKQPIKYNGMFVVDLRVDQSSLPQNWSSTFYMPKPVLTLSFYLVSEEYKAHRYSKYERDIFDQYVKNLYEKGARVEITG